MGMDKGGEMAMPIAEADRIRTALLAAVSHDLRTPLAAATAAVSCLRATDMQLTAEDHDELLATAEEIAWPTQPSARRPA
jgi:two-component system sensor histidine kinase KdpD